MVSATPLTSPRPRYAGSRADCSVERREGIARRERLVAQVRLDGQSSSRPVNTVRRTSVPMILPGRPASADALSNEVAKRLRAGWLRDGETLGWFGGQLAQTELIDQQRQQIEQLQHDLRAERQARQQAMASRSEMMASLNDAFSRITALQRECDDYKYRLAAAERGVAHSKRNMPDQEARQYASPRPTSRPSSQSDSAPSLRASPARYLSSSPRVTHQPSGARRAPALQTAAMEAATPKAKHEMHPLRAVTRQDV